MVLAKIETLLEKYDNGETTLQEEQQLKSYFSKETVAPHLEVYKPMFVYFSQTQQEQFTKDVPLEAKKTYTLYKWISVAAVTVLMLGVYFQTNKTQEAKNYAGLSIEEKAIYDNTMLAFDILSKNFKKGEDNLKSLDLMSSSLKQGTENMAYLGEFSNTERKIFNNN